MKKDRKINLEKNMQNIKNKSIVFLPLMGFFKQINDINSFIQTNYKQLLYLTMVLNLEEKNGI